MKKIKLVTHSGVFHADDVFATAVLAILFEKQNKEFEVIRSREQQDIEAGDIVYDNGREYDFDKKIFDHHQEGGAGERDNGVPYAGFGLIWKHYGKELIVEFFENKLDEKQINQIHQLMDESVVQPIDASDTGYEDYKSTKKDLRTYTFDSFVNAFRPTNEEGYESAQNLFMQVVDIAKQILKRELISKESKIKGFEKAEEAYQNAEDKRIIILNERVSWKEIMVSNPEPLFVIYPEIDTDRYKIQAVPKEMSGYELRKGFPQEWCGKNDEELEQISGVVGAKFCHLKGFLCVADTKDQAVEIAKIAVDK
jgi:uncharacterized UPF0160 family protein